MNVTVDRDAVKVLSGTAGLPVGVAGETIQQGDVIRLNGNVWNLAEAGESESEANVTAMAVTPASEGETFAMARSGADVSLGADALEQGETYVVSRTKGAIMPIGDLDDGDNVKVVGNAITDTVLRFEVLASTPQKPTTTTTTTTGA